MLEDSTFWIGTRKGLNRLESRGDHNICFRRFYPERTNKETTSEWSISDIFEDMHGEFWIGTWGGAIVHFDKNNGSFSHYFPPFNLNITNEYVINDYESSNDSILLAASYGGRLYLFNTVTRQYLRNTEKYISTELNMDNLTVVTMKMDKRGKLWLGTTNRLIVYDPQKKKIEHRGTPINPVDPYKFKDQARTIFEDSNDLIWIGYLGHGIDLFDRDYKKLLKWRYALKSSAQYRDYVTSTRLDNYGFLWLTTWGDGLLKTTPKGEILERYRFSEKMNHMDGDILTSLEIDIRGHLWIGSLKGLIHFDPNTRKIIKICNHDPANPESITDDHIISMYSEDNGMLWIITQEGIRKIDPISEKMSKMPFVEE